MWNIYLIQSSEETADENRAQNRNIFTDVYFLSFNEVVFKSTLMWVENTTKIHAEVEAAQEKNLRAEPGVQPFYSSFLFSFFLQQVQKYELNI